MKYYLIAGEPSGDLHAAQLMKSILEVDSQADFRFWGGDLMAEQGGTMVQHYKDMSFMGFKEVVKHLPTILKKIKQCKKDIKSYKPDALILIDYPGFNLKIAKYAKSIGLKVFYYISPKVWAWNSKRVKTIKKVVDRMYVIFPFEVAFYKNYDYEVDFIGNPLVDIIDSKQLDPNFIGNNSLTDQPIISLLPGSRKQEIVKILPEMLKLVQVFGDHQFLLGTAPSIPKELYHKVFAKEGVSVPLIDYQTYDLIKNSEIAVVTSGTVSLEAALLNTPQIVCYKTSPITYKIAKKAIKVDYISLVNLIMNQEVVKEFIQDDLHIDNLVPELNKLRHNAPDAMQMREAYSNLREMIKNPDGPASLKAAKSIYKHLNV
ncbi:lipid-A-disaccharide synthase [bacterium AH-315-C07]|nr:lipid-A-disaccharide synthase [bacterium AH-315-C07]